MTSTIHFPRTSSERVLSMTSSETSLIRNTSTATIEQLCQLVYGSVHPRETQEHPGEIVDRLYESNAIYENPLVTATSRSIIHDMYSLAGKFKAVDVPRPLAVLNTLFRLNHQSNLMGDHEWGDGSEPWFQGLRVWTEIGEITESESFDGHRRNVVEHTVNVLFLPDLHVPRNRPPLSTPPSNELSIRNSRAVPAYPLEPALAVPGTSLSIPSPLHFQLPVITQLSFNESGRITHHRDIWDIKDVVALLPGAVLAQWFFGRANATGLAVIARIFRLGRKNDIRRWSAEDVETATLRSNLKSPQL